jgi:hypothetical protein
MLALFTTCVCEHCDGAAEGDFFRGWVVWPERPERGGTIQTWVFRTREDARKWLRSRADGVVRPVLSREPFAWTRSRGAMKDIVLAERPFEIFPDHRHPPGTHRAFLAPEGAPDADRVRLRRTR